MCRESFLLLKQEKQHVVILWKAAIFGLRCIDCNQRKEAAQSDNIKAVSSIEQVSGFTKVSHFVTASLILFKEVRPITHLFHHHKACSISILILLIYHKNVYLSPPTLYTESKKFYLYYCLVKNPSRWTFMVREAFL